MAYWGFLRYVTVTEKKEKAARKLKALSKKNLNLKPVILQGTVIARTWWGRAWNLNLEQYADYHNRIGRGRSYVRHGAVLDLQIDPGEARSLVQGSRSKPYSVVIIIKALKKEVWQRILNQCQGMLESLQELMAGNFPKTIGEVFTHKDSGMFPSVKEITFSCSCPDWAGMCKHVAATLYGIGARLDESPDLFFKMRKVEMRDLIQQAVADHKEKLLERASRKSHRIIEDADLSATFGIELQDVVPLSPASTGVSVLTASHRSKRVESSQKAKSPARNPSRAKGLKEAQDSVAKRMITKKKLTNNTEKKIAVRLKAKQARRK